MLVWVESLLGFPAENSVNTFFVESAFAVTVFFAELNVSPKALPHPPWLSAHWAGPPAIFSKRFIICIPPNHRMVYSNKDSLQCKDMESSFRRMHFHS